MKYSKVTVKSGKSYWTAQPESAEELLYSLMVEGPWLDKDPNIEHDDELLNMFL
jgi:hypothetical protein